MEAIINFVFRAGARRGFRGSQPWLIVAIIAGTMRLMRKLANPKPDTVWRQVLRPHSTVHVRSRRETWVNWNDSRVPMTA